MPIVGHRNRRRVALGSRHPSPTHRTLTAAAPRVGSPVARPRRALLTGPIQLKDPDVLCSRTATHV